MNKSIEVKVGKRYQLTRELLLFTIDEVYLITKIPETTLRRIEKGNFPSSQEYTDKLCYLYQTDKEDLYNLNKQLPDWKTLRRRTLSEHKADPFIISTLNKQPMPKKAIQFRVLKSSFLNNFKSVRNTLTHLKNTYSWTYSDSEISNAYESLKADGLIEIEGEKARPQKFRKARSTSKEDDKIIEQLSLYLEESTPQTTLNLVTPAFEKMAGMLFFLINGRKKRGEIFNSVNYSNLHKNHQKSLKILEDLNLVGKTIKEKPTSSLQTYQLTEKGRDIVNRFM